MVEVSDELRARLTREGMNEAKRQLDHVNEKAGGARHNATRQVPRQGGDFDGVRDMGLRQFAQRKTRNGANWLKLIVSDRR